MYRRNWARTGSETQIKKRRESGGSRNERRKQRAPRIGQCGARHFEQQVISDADILAPDRRIELQGTLTVMSHPYSTTRLTPTPIGAFEMTPDHLESDSA